MVRPPADYSKFDETVVLQLVAGRWTGGRPDTADAAEAIRRLALAEYTDGQIAYLLGFRRRSVLRIRTKRGIRAGFGRNQDPRLRKHDVPNRPARAG